MAGIVAFLGGARATVFAGVALLLLGLLGFQTVRLSASKAEHDRYVAKVQQATAIAAQKAAESAKRAAEARQEYYATLQRADAAYAAGRESAITYQKTVVDDLRSGNVRLRNEWSACMSRAPKVAAAGTAAGVGDQAADLFPEALGRVLRVGADADNEVRYYQQALKATRKAYAHCAGIQE